MDSIKSFAEGIAVPLLLALFGGAARAVRRGVKSWRQFAGSLFVSGFAGLIVHLLLQDVNLSASVKGALVGLSGYSGGTILDGLASRAQRRIEPIIGPGDEPCNGVERRKVEPEKNDDEV